MSDDWSPFESWSDYDEYFTIGDDIVYEGVKYGIRFLLGDPGRILFFSEDMEWIPPEDPLFEKLKEIFNYQQRTIIDVMDEEEKS